jgi:hypothetical protein
LQPEKRTLLATTLKLWLLLRGDKALIAQYTVLGTFRDVRTQSFEIKYFSYYKYSKELWEVMSEADFDYEN